MTTRMCIVSECHNVARSDRDVCNTHCNRKYRPPGKGGLPMSEPIKERPKTPQERLLSAAIRLAELKPTDDQGWERARDNLRKSAVRYAESLPKFKPLQHYVEGFPVPQELAA